MWSDNETNKDFLNFLCVAETAAEMIVQASGQPLSMGVSGGWGAGKSTMLNLISDSLKSRCDGQFLFVEFNAWLYQGYDDARAALMEVIVRKLIDHGEASRTGLDKAKDLLRRVNWLRLAGLTAGPALSIATGGFPVGLIANALSFAKDLTDGRVEAQDIATVRNAGEAIVEEGRNLIKPSEESSPPQQIQELRNHLEETLGEMGITLVVFVDDLDRCLPTTAIATLEAIRLFLFLPNTAFVIAADDRMIRHAVRVHFLGADLDDELVTNYFDKLVQVPIRVPPLGTQEVRAYLMMLFVENSDVDSEQREMVRAKVCQRLSETWKGHRVDLNFVSGLIKNCPDKLKANLELADRLAPLMTTSMQIAGNPRLIKRFLNTLSIRLSIARSQEVAVDEGALAKMLLFERCARTEAYNELIAEINHSDEGKPSFLSDWEEQAQAGESLNSLKGSWNTPFVRNWLALPPLFSDLDLRSVVYVSREHIPVITHSDQLSSEAAEMLEALLGLEGDPSNTIEAELRSLAGWEIALITERLLVRARQVQSWGTPPVLWSLIAVINVDPEQAHPVVSFLESIPRSLLRPEIVPALNGREWARPILELWSQDSGTPNSVKRALQVMEKEGS